MVSFFCVLAPEGMNAIVFGEDEGGELRRLLLARKIYRPEDYFLSLTSSKEKGLIILQKSKEIAFIFIVHSK